MKNLIILSLAAFFAIVTSCSKSADSTNTGNGSSNSGKSGSMAAMVVHGNYLYKLSDGKNILTYNISTDSTAILVSNTAAVNTTGTTLETIYVSAEKKLLFLGSTTGMYIYDISNPGTPTFVSLYAHIRRCDPVVVNGDYAYVTLRGGNFCGGTTNALEVIDISNIQSPQLNRTINLTSPYGLDFDGNNLFVCDGGNGLKWFDISDPKTPVYQTTFNGLDAYDVITLGSRIILVGKTGVYQYNINGSNSEFLSQIPIITP